MTKEPAKTPVPGKSGVRGGYLKYQCPGQMEHFAANEDLRRRRASGRGTFLRFFRGKLRKIERKVSLIFVISDKAGKKIVK